MKPDSDRKTITLTQKRLLVGGQQIELTADDKVKIRNWGQGGRHEVTFKLAEVDPDPSIVRQHSWFSLFAALFVSFFALVIFFGAVAEGFSKDPTAESEPLFWMSGLFAIISVFAYRDYRSKSVDVIRFHTETGGHFPVWRKLPSLKASEAFLEELIERIQEAKAARKGSYNETLADEIRGLDKLRAEGVLTEEEFRKAKARLLGLETGMPDLPPPSFEAGKN